MESAPMAGHLAGAAEPEFPAGAPPLSTAESDDTADYRPFPEADPPYPGEPDETARPRLGTFLLTDSVHVNRPVYRHVHHATYLYFDYLVRVDGSHVPLWIIGPEPRRLPSLDSWRLLFVIDAARRPEAITGCWQYRTGRRQTAALVDVRCEHGRVGPAPAAGADCDFELPGGCGYRAGSGQLTQTQYTSQGRAAAHRADAADPGSFHAEVAPAADLSADVTSPTFTTETDSCLTLVYRMRTRQYFRASFELVGDSLDVALTLASAERGWARLAHPVPPGSYRLKVRGHMSAAADRLLFDSVRVLAGNCSRPALPCDQQPCRNGGTCHPLDAKVYTCACRAGFQSAGCQASVTCAPPPAVRDGRLLATSAPGDSLPTARYECLAGTTFASPLTRTIASCVRGRWLGVPSCVHGRDTSEREREKDDHDAASTDPRGAGPGLTSSVTSVCGLATLLATVAARLWT